MKRGLWDKVDDFSRSIEGQREVFVISSLKSKKLSRLLLHFDM